MSTLRAEVKSSLLEARYSDAVKLLNKIVDRFAALGTGQASTSAAQATVEEAQSLLEAFSRSSTEESSSLSKGDQGELLLLLLRTLPELEFESRKDVVGLFGTLLRVGSLHIPGNMPSERQTSSKDQASNDPKSGEGPLVPTPFQRFLARTDFIRQLLALYISQPELSLNYGIILREFCRYPYLTKKILQEKVIYQLFRCARTNSNFDLAADAFLSIKELLCRHKEVSARFILENLEEFFEAFHGILLDDTVAPVGTIAVEKNGPLQVVSTGAGGSVDGNNNLEEGETVTTEESTEGGCTTRKPPPVLIPHDPGAVDVYVCQRQSLKLLSDMLLDRSYMQCMLRYINEDQYLVTHMKFLRSSSKTIQFESFHIFKIFSANPNKTTRVTRLLYQNKEKLMSYLETFLQPERNVDQQFLQDKATVIQKLKALELPE